MPRLEINAVNNPEQNFITVDQFSQTLDDLFRQNYGFSRFYVLGEVKAAYTEADLKYLDRHLYFTLEGKDSSLKCAVWRSNLANLDFIPLSGMQIIAEISVSYYQKGSSITATVWQVYDYGEGKKKREREKLIKELTVKGYFSTERKRKIPLNPAVVGIVTSETGAAVKDIKENAYKRFPLIDFIVYNTLVQGETAPFEIKKAIEKANLEKKAEVLIVGRGGGSKEDLAAFDTKEVADAIFNSKIPVISAVGHERDVSISDYVADATASTPTDAAALVTQITTEQFKGFLKEHQDAIFNNLANKINQENASLRVLESALERVSPLSKLTEKQQELIIFQNQNKAAMHSLYLKKQNTLSLALQKIQRLVAVNYNKTIDAYETILVKMPNLHKVLSENKAKIADFKLKLPDIPRQIQEKEFQLKIFKEKLNNFDVNKNLKQGYALVFKDKSMVKSIQEVYVNDELEIKLKDGTFKVVVTKTKGE